jgi:hypothetical protein
MRLASSLVAGAAIASGAAIVLGDYPVTGAVMWSSAVLIPALILAGMSLVAGRARRIVWVAGGLLGGASMAWGVRIATGWGLDPTPGFAIAAMVVALVWPVAVGFLRAGSRRLTN